MLVKEIISEQRDFYGDSEDPEVIQLFKKSHVSVLDILERVTDEMPDIFLDQTEEIIKQVPNCNGCTEETVFVKKNAASSILRAIRSGDYEQALELIDQNKTTIQNWAASEGSNDIEELKYQRADRQERDRDVYAYHGVSRSDF